MSLNLKIPLGAGGRGRLTIPVTALQPIAGIDAEADKTLDPNVGKPIESFVSATPSFYQERMSRGDKAFRNGRYADANDWFAIASTIARGAPEGHLSRTHALFATGAYHQASYHLQEALERFPKLPLVHLTIRKFYGKDLQVDFDEHLQALAQDATGPVLRFDSLLLLAYVQYFDGKADQAASALKKIHALADPVKDEPVRRAAAVFWDGMVEAGQAQGTLGPTSRPATEPDKKGDQAPDDGSGASSPPSSEDGAGKAGTSVRPAKSQLSINKAVSLSPAAAKP